MGAKSKKPEKRRSIDEQYELDRAQMIEGFFQQFKRWQAVSRINGETYQLCLFEKSNAEIDDDVRRLFIELVRRIRGILVDDEAKQVLLEVVGVVEDDDEIGLRLYSEVDLSRFAAAPVTRLSHFSLEGDRAFPSQG